MRRTRHDSTPTDFLPEALPASIELVEVRDNLARLEQQVLALYTSSAAYATIARQHADGVRAEARADLDRVEAKVLGLLDTLRADTCARVDPAAPTAEPASRLAVLEAQLAAMGAALERSQHEQAALRDQIDRLVQERMQADGWLASTGPAESLALR